MFDPKQFIEDQLKDWLSQMNLVTREEFDAQAQILAKTRAKVDELTQRLKQFESIEG